MSLLGQECAAGEVVGHDRRDPQDHFDGVGREPGVWSHGLGLGGVRKRVRQLGGDVEWQELQPVGIRCLVRIPHFTGAGPTD